MNFPSNQASWRSWLCLLPSSFSDKFLVSRGWVSAVRETCPFSPEKTSRGIQAEKSQQLIRSGVTLCCYTDLNRKRSLAIHWERSNRPKATFALPVHCLKSSAVEPKVACHPRIGFKEHCRYCARDLNILKMPRNFHLIVRFRTNAGIKRHFENLNVSFTEVFGAAFASESSYHAEIDQSSIFYFRSTLTGIGESEGRSLVLRVTDGNNTRERCEKFGVLGRGRAERWLTRTMVPNSGWWRKKVAQRLGSCIFKFILHVSIKK